MRAKTRLSLSSVRVWWKKGIYPEDEANDYDYSLYQHPKQIKTWYAANEIRESKQWLQHQTSFESENHRQGKHHTGMGAFERELQRKGMQIEKYRLPSTTAVKRVHEMVQLKRKALEKRAAKSIESQKPQKPSEWYDETDGPMNPHFLQFAQKSFAEPFADLPRRGFRPRN